MAESHALELNARLVSAYEAGEGSFPVVARRFGVGQPRCGGGSGCSARTDGDLAPRKGCGTPSGIAAAAIKLLLAELPDPNAGERTVAGATAARSRA
jgi:hypothetical protein